MPTHSEYRISSRDYLHRARTQLASGSPESLFYAAFELRCGVEARLQEYLEPREDVSKRIREGWKIPLLSKGVDPDGDWGDKVLRLGLHNIDSGELIQELFYTPVREELRKQVQQLGGMLHAAKKFREPSSSWWGQARSDLEAAAEGLAFSTTGQLLAVPVVHPETGSSKMYAELGETSTWHKCLTQGQHVAMEVTYHDELAT